VIARLAWALRRVIGAPDYDAYVAHVGLEHPGTEPMSAEEFAREALARRYERVGSRCC
jgi:uncharacterized short protein YbdD (DUF466 family)